MQLEKCDFVYVKNGDVIADLARIDSATPIELLCGPDAFLQEFLQVTYSQRVLLLSTTNRMADTHQYSEMVLAKTFQVGATWLAKLVSKPRLMIFVLRNLVRAQPRYLLCGANFEPLWASFLYASIVGIPLVHSKHNRVTGGKSSLYRRIAVKLDSWVIRKSVGVICHGPYLREELLDVGVPSSQIYEFDVSLREYRDSAKKDAPDVELEIENNSLIVYAGRIERLKGVFDLLDAIEPHLRQYGGLILAYAGQGSALDDLRAEVNRRKLMKQVRLMGRIAHRALALLMSRASLVITPTQSRFAEGRCMAAMESLVLGVPVIAPRFGPFPYLVTDGVNGLLYEPDSVDDLRDKISRVLANKEFLRELRLGAKNTGERLLAPPMTFGQAVKLAFEISVVEKNTA